MSSRARAGAIAVGGVSGGAVSPAVGFGVILAGAAAGSMLWVYLARLATRGSILVAP